MPEMVEIITKKFVRLCPKPHYQKYYKLDESHYIRGLDLEAHRSKVDVSVDNKV